MPLPDPPSRTIVTVDVEEWYDVNYTSADWSRTDTSTSRVRDNTWEILEILARTGSKATFFVLGRIARHYPELVNAIDRQGHEVACHGEEHELLYDLNPSQFRQSLRRSVDRLSSLTGKNIIGFRAPSCSITEKNPWALEILCEQGFLYDSSIFPIENYMYGVRGFPVCPCRLTTGGGHRLIEIPPSVTELGRLRIPFGGGVYLRILPSVLQRRLISIARARGRPFMLYFHPADIDTKHMKIRLSPRERFFHNVGRRNARHKIMNLLKEYRWTTISDAFSAHLDALRTGKWS